MAKVEKPSAKVELSNSSIMATLEKPSAKVEKPSAKVELSNSSIMATLEKPSAKVEKPSAKVELSIGDKVFDNKYKKEIILNPFYFEVSKRKPTRFKKV